MSEPLCLRCLFARGERAQKIAEKFKIQCPTCVHNTEQKECIDGCGTSMCFCDFFGYWHNEKQPKMCLGYKKRK